MGQFLHKYNTDNVHARAVIIGLVNLLNSKIQFENVLSDTDIDTVTVPFFYSMTGDERFLQDYFLEWNECIHPKIADGNYDVIPRGIVNLTSTAINTTAMTHRFVRGSYVREVNGELQTFNSFLNSIPLTMNFDVEIHADTNLDAFKIQQAVIETFYKTQVYSVSYRGFRVPCQVGFPEDYGLERPIEFTYQADTPIKLKFSLALETYFPVIDPTTTRKNSNRMTTFGPQPDRTAGTLIDMTVGNTEINRRPIGFTFTQPTPNGKYFSGSLLPIRWSSTGTINNVNLYYRIVGGDWIEIVKNYENCGEYDWTIPFFNQEGTTIFNDPVRAVVISESNAEREGNPALNQCKGQDARVRAIVNTSGGVERIIVLRGGFCYSSHDTILVTPFTIPPDVATFTPPFITANVADGQVVGSVIHTSGSGMTPSPSTFIELKIESSVDSSIYKVYEVEKTFTADTDPFYDPIGPGMRYVSNLLPTVSDLIAEGANLLTGIDGPGVEVGTVVVNADPTNNRLTVNKDVTSLVTGGEYKLGFSTAIFEIQ